MKVHLIKTPEYDLNSFNEVRELLCSFDGPLEFVQSIYVFDKKEFYFLRYELFPHHGFKYESETKQVDFNINRGFPLSWEELFSLCNFYRSKFNINQNDFVILLTNRKNALNWFSIFDELNNAFIHCGDWELFLKAPHKFPVAYEVAANVLRKLMNLPLKLPSQFFHDEPIGCFNDLCANKKNIILKLRTADICSQCIDKINQEGIEANILNQILRIFEGIRIQLLFRQGFKQQKEPVPIVINEKNQIILPALGNLEIKLTPLFKTLYIFYLSHPNGVRLNELNDFKTELLNIYKRLTVSDGNPKAEASIKELIDPFGNSFSQKKSKINKIITELLNEPLACFYRIEGNPGEPFKINLPNNLIDIRY